ncbi:RDD family protein [bacterium]|nr:RDD family protein [bacterium]
MNIRASRWARLQAAILDWVYCWWPLFLAAVACALYEEIFHASRQISEEANATIFFTGFAVSIVLLVRNLWLFARTGQTWGKQRMNLLVVMENGRRASSTTLYWRAFSPYVLMMIPLANMLTQFDAWFILGSTRRCLHDFMAGTIVLEADSYEEPSGDGIGLSPSYDDIGFTRVR